MPSNTSSNQIGDLYLSMYKNAVNQTVNESVQSDTKENLKKDYYSNTPFHKFQTDYSLMYESYQVTSILRESWNRDLNTIAYLLERDEELCNEVFGGLVQKAKQGIQAGAQAVQQKLLQPLLQMIISKIPKQKQEELAKAAQGGPQALQTFINKEGDPKVAKEIAGTQTNESLSAMVELIGFAHDINNKVITEGIGAGGLQKLRSILGTIGKEANDPAVKTQVQQLQAYLKANYDAKGQLKAGGKAPASGTPAPAPAATPGAPTPATPGASAATPGAPGPLPASAATPGGPGPLPAPAPAATPGAPTPATPGASAATPGAPTPAPAPGAPAAGGGGFISKALNWMKNNKALTAAGAIGLIGAIALATGGIGLPALTPGLLAALKSAGVSGAVGAVGGAIKGAQGGGGLKGAAKGALKGGAIGAAVGGAGSLIGQAAADATGLSGPEQEADGSALPKPEAPPGTGPEDVEAQYKAAGLTTPPEALGPEEPAGPPVAPTPTAPPGGFAADQPASTEVKGSEQMQNLANKAQYGKVAANLQPGEKIVQDTLGRFRRVRQ